MGKIISGSYLCHFTIGLLSDILDIIASHTKNNAWDTQVLANPQDMNSALEWLHWCKVNPRKLWSNPVKNTIWFSSDATLESASAVFWGSKPEFCPTIGHQTKIFQAKTDIVPSKTNITINEAFAIKWGLDTLLDKALSWTKNHNLDWKSTSIIWATDNQACEWSFRKGRSKELSVHQLVQSYIQDFTFKRNIHLQFVYIPSKINKTADDISRIQFSHQAFQIPLRVIENFHSWCSKHQHPIPNADAFASRKEKTCLTFCNKYLDTGCLGNIFETNLNKSTVLWCNPPNNPRFVDAFLNKINKEKITSWLVTQETPNSQQIYFSFTRGGDVTYFILFQHSQNTYHTEW